MGSNPYNILPNKLLCKNTKKTLTFQHNMFLITNLVQKNGLLTYNGNESLIP